MKGINDIRIENEESYKETRQEQGDKVHKPIAILHDHKPRLAQEYVFVEPRTSEILEMAHQDPLN